MIELNSNKARERVILIKTIRRIEIETGDRKNLIIFRDLK